MNAPPLRLYQLNAITQIMRSLANGGSVLAVSPTGSGKTNLAAAMIKQEVEQGNCVLVLASRRELIHQASRKLDDVGVHHGIILAGDRRQNLYAPVQVASIDTLRARQGRLQMLEPDLVIVDEAHLFCTPIRQRLLDQWPNARRLGLTATPCRKDGRGLRLLFKSMIEVATVADLTAQGYLVCARYFSIAEPDLAAVSTVGADYHQGELAGAMLQLVADIPATWMERAGGRRTVVFAVNVAHSIALCAEFQALGVVSEHVDGGTPVMEREAILRRFESGDTQVLCNCQIASIGFDLPALSCIQLARPTKSLAMYLQMLGRGLRPAPGKTDCLVLDHSGAVHRHGFAHDERHWSLEGHADMATVRTERERTEGKTIDCPECNCVYTGPLCPECGHHIRRRGKPIQTLDGELVEVGAHLGDDEASRLQFFLELRGYGEQHRYRSGWASHKFKEKFGGGFPPWKWNDQPAAVPTLATRNWVKSRMIAAARGARATA